MSKFIAISGGINWTWYIEGEITSPGHVTIASHYRLHDYRDIDHPTPTHVDARHYRETDDRTWLGFSMYPVGEPDMVDAYTIDNPKHIFSY